MSEDRAGYGNKEETQKCKITITIFDSKRVRISQSGNIAFKYIAFIFARYLAWLLKRIKPDIGIDDNLVNQAKKGFLVEFDSALDDPDGPLEVLDE